MSWKSFWLLLTETLTMALMSRVFFFFMRSESSGVWLSGGRSGDSVMRPAAAPLYLSLTSGPLYRTGGGSTFPKVKGLSPHTLGKKMHQNEVKKSERRAHIPNTVPF